MAMLGKYDTEKAGGGGGGGEGTTYWKAVYGGPSGNSTMTLLSGTSFSVAAYPQIVAMYTHVQPPPTFVGTTGMNAILLLASQAQALGAASMWTMWGRFTMQEITDNFGGLTDPQGGCMRNNQMNPSPMTVGFYRDDAGTDPISEFAVTVGA